MKIRNGFVSNSSSSSFVVIKDGNLSQKEDLAFQMFEADLNSSNSKELLYVIGEHGETEFGWGIEDINDVDSKVNWAYLQANYCPDLKEAKKCKEMLFKVLKECSDNVEIANADTAHIDSLVKEYGAWIDHQSTSDESPENLDIFKDEETLKKFLFNEDSFIHVDNDNH